LSVLATYGRLLVSSPNVFERTLNIIISYDKRSCTGFDIWLQNVIDGPTEVRLGMYVSNIAIYGQASFDLLHKLPFTVDIEYIL